MLRTFSIDKSLLSATLFLFNKATVHTMRMKRNWKCERKAITILKKRGMEHSNNTQSTFSSNSYWFKMNWRKWKLFAKSQMSSPCFATRAVLPLPRRGRDSSRSTVATICSSDGCFACQIVTMSTTRVRRSVNPILLPNMQSVVRLPFSCSPFHLPVKLQLLLNDSFSWIPTAIRKLRCEIRILRTRSLTSSEIHSRQ